MLRPTRFVSGILYLALVSLFPSVRFFLLPCVLCSPASLFCRRLFCGLDRALRVAVVVVVAVAAAGVVVVVVIGARAQAGFPLELKFSCPAVRVRIWGGSVSAATSSEEQQLTTECLCGIRLSGHGV